MLSVLDYYKLYVYKLLCTLLNIIFISLGTQLLPWITACLNFKLCVAKSINKNKHFLIKWSELYLITLFFFFNKQNIPSYWYMNKISKMVQTAYTFKWIENIKKKSLVYCSITSTKTRKLFFRLVCYTLCHYLKTNKVWNEKLHECHFIFYIKRFQIYNRELIWFTILYPYNTLTSNNHFLLLLDLLI